MELINDIRHLLGKIFLFLAQFFMRLTEICIKGQANKVCRKYGMKDIEKVSK